MGRDAGDRRSRTPSCQHAIRTSPAAARSEDARARTRSCRTSPAIGMLGVVAYIGVPLLGCRRHHDRHALCDRHRGPQGVDRRRRARARRISPRPSPPTWRRGRRRSSSARGSTSRPSRAGPGSAADTLRKWERRYGVLRPSRTSGGQRRYDERDVARGGMAAATASPRASGSARRPALLGPTSCDGAAILAAELRDAIVAAVAETDTRRLARARRAVVSRSTSSRPPSTRSWRAAARAGRRPLGGRRRADVARGASRSARSCARASGAAPGRPPPAVRGVAVLACAPGERHELGLLDAGRPAPAPTAGQVLPRRRSRRSRPPSRSRSQHDADLLCLSAASPTAPRGDRAPSSRDARAARAARLVTRRPRRTARVAG